MLCLKNSEFLELNQGDSDTAKIPFIFSKSHEHTSTSLNGAPSLGLSVEGANYRHRAEPAIYPLQGESREYFRSSESEDGSISDDEL